MQSHPRHFIISAKRHDKIGHQGGRGLRPRITLSIVRKTSPGAKRRPFTGGSEPLGNLAVQVLALAPAAPGACNINTD